uniref:FAM13A-like domain-containing protein n=1 Tax=Chromera velia CCMP2878 TaxID=1169474 RepID=A0A0G4GUA0_9ALVE|eukprot:Cvel_23406.t1-p1 / transcript=Cvel_23406.t1 / gene=Cvel_23406 / organism=Chromera_velia_CCMP2878 / gene_product=hypothetical protein / transcript_product=hypothetical protein / location=Cvel_scaffold2408:4249-5724(+) / protein_length=492 / sequence_SO=supercontig / SO=protein_coding / is_pseudo=false
MLSDRETTEVLSSILASTVSSFFPARSQSLQEASLNFRLVGVSNEEKPIPVRWVEDTTIEDVGAFTIDGDDQEGLTGELKTPVRPESLGSSGWQLGDPPDSVRRLDSGTASIVITRAAEDPGAAEEGVGAGQRGTSTSTQSGTQRQRETGWNFEEGRRRLFDALNRLNLILRPTTSGGQADDRQDGDDDSDEMGGGGGGVASKETMQVDSTALMEGRVNALVEKKRVKQELKRYDVSFQENFGRNPTRQEKEPMRPLYTYYRRLKKQIVSQGGESGGAPQHQPPPGSDHAAPSAPGPRDRATPTEPERDPHPSQQRERDAASQQRRQRDSRGSERDRPAQPPPLLPLMAGEHPSAHPQGLSLGPEVRRHPRGPTATPEGNLPGGSSHMNLPAEYESSAEGRRLRALLDERAALRRDLEVFQEAFYKREGRRIKYHRDILPIENEYRQYRELKREIVRLEEALGVVRSSSAQGGGGSINVGPSSAASAEGVSP